MEIQEYQRNLLKFVQDMGGMIEPEPEKPRRLVAKMAKNINPGDLVEFNGYGWREVAGWSKMGDRVTLSAENLPFQHFEATQRVRVQRHG